MTDLPPSDDIDILVIDNTLENIKVLTQILADQGYHIRPETDGKRGLTTAKLLTPALILLDIQMPDINGYEICKQLKADAATQDIPVIFLTVLDEIEDVVTGLELGAVDYIIKPFRQRELIVKIDNQIRLRSLEKKLTLQNQRLQTLLTQTQIKDAALQESEDKFSKAFHHSPIALAIISLDNASYLHVNDELIKRTGYSRDELIGRSVTTMKFWVELEERTRYYEILQANGEVRDFKTRLYDKSGTIHDVVMSADIIFLDEMPYLLSATIDVTEFKTTQKSLAMRSQELSETLKALKETQSQLVESAKMAALGNLVAGVAHEINTPLGTAIMMASTLENSTQAISSELESATLTQSGFSKYLEIATETSHLISDNLNRAGELVQSFKQVAVDQMSLEARPFNVKMYLQEIIINLSSRLKQTPHQIVVTGNDDIEVYSYPGALYQIVTNLVNNALMHAFSEDTAGEIHFSLFKEGQYWGLHYQDNGVGISQDIVKLIFEPFFTTARHKGGSGLGLHIVYNLVTRSLNGEISVHSSVDDGTGFRIIVPFDHSNP